MDVVVQVNAPENEPVEVARLVNIAAETNPPEAVVVVDSVVVHVPSGGVMAVGAVAPDRDPPYKLSRKVIETAISEQGFQLFRLTKKD